MDVLEGLRANALTRDVTGPALASLVDRLAIECLADGDVLFREGDPGDAIFLVLDGLIHVFADRDGREVSVASFGPGTFLGELALLGAESRTATARAVEATVVARIDRESFVVLTAQQPVVMANVSRSLVRNLVSTTRAMVQHVRGEVVAVVADDVTLVRDLPAFLGAELTRMRREPVAIITTEPAGAGDRVIGIDSVRRAEDQPAPSIWGREADESSPGDLVDLLAIHIDAFRREWSRTVVIGTLAELLPSVEAGWFDRVFALCNRSETPSQLAKIARPERDWTLEVVPARSSEVDAGAWHRLITSAPLDRPTIFLNDQAGSGLARLARAVARQRVGVAFGAGGARGFAHIGVLRLLEELGVPIDALSGSSIGSLVASARAAGIGSTRAEEMLTHWLSGGQRQILRPAWSRHSLLSGKGLDRTCRELFDDLRFSELETPLAVSVSDLSSGRGLIVRDGPVWRAVRASCSIPGVFPPVVVGDRVLVDGGVCDPVPSEALRRMGVDILIAVNISFSPEDLDRWSIAEGFESPRSAVSRGRLPNAIETYNASFGMALSDRAATSSSLADVVVRPQFRVTAWHDFASGPDQLRRGYEAAQRSADDLHRAIPWLESSERSRD